MKRAQRKRKRTEFDSPARVASPARKVDTIAELCAALRGGKLEAPKNASADDVADALDELDAFIGVESVKRVVLEMVLLSCLGLSDARDFTNVVLTGNPGTGKTELCGVVSRVWRSVFHGKRGRVTWLCRAQLIGEHLGETSMKTMRALSSAIPGVVVLDEVYALGSGERDKDSFSKECIDAINQFLSECRESITVVVAGYRDETERCFFARNQGLERRFPWRFNIDDYAVADLVRIAEKQLADSSWYAFDGWTKDTVFLAELAVARNNGGDTQAIIHACKLAHARRIPPEAERRVISEQDLHAGCRAWRTASAHPVEPVPVGMYT
jgi:SpoVK/Ycf46/Vps4 family AAA+-type ATPase